MQKLFLIFTVLLVSSMCIMPIFADSSLRQSSINDISLQNVQIPFIENMGQKHNDVKFYVNTLSSTVFITNDSLVYYMSNLSSDDNLDLVIQEKFITSQTIVPTGVDKTITVMNYFMGSSDNWRSNIPTYDTISLDQVWPSIDVQIKTTGNTIEKIFVVNPEGAPKDIQIKIDGVDKISIDHDKNLILETKHGEVLMSNPIAFQLINNSKEFVDASYVIDENNSYGFMIGEYDTTYPLIIDPLFASTLIGGPNNEGLDITTDSNGNVFVTGVTYIRSYPILSGPFHDPTSPSLELSRDVIISKLDNDLTTLYASTIIMGEGNDFGKGITVDSNGNVFVTGFTSSSDYPEKNAFRESERGNSDVFITKLDNNLSDIIASTVFGGGQFDGGTSITNDDTGVIFVGGTTQSNNFPTTENAFASASGFTDPFVVKFTNDLTALSSSTVLGSKYSAENTDLIIDSGTDVFITGHVLGPNNFPISSDSFVLEGEENDVFVAKLDYDLSTLVASSVFGGKKADIAYGIAIDSEKNVFVTGKTLSDDFPTTVGAYNNAHNSFPQYDDVFVSKLDNNLTSLISSTYVGGLYDDVGNGIGVDVNGFVIITGSTFSHTFPTIGTSAPPYDYTFNGPGSNDVFVTKFTNDLSQIDVSTFIGGMNNEHGRDLSFDSDYNVFVTGKTKSENYPVTTGVYNEHHSDGGTEIFVTKLPNDLGHGSAPVPPTPSPTPPPNSGGGCLIATAAYGTELAPQVQFLREIRDNTVMSTSSGTAFMTGFNQLYYSFSPTIADMERENPMFQEAVRAFITPMISSLSILAISEDGNDMQVLGLGISVITLNLGMYIAVPALIGIKSYKHFKSIS